MWETGPANVQTVQARIKGRALAYTTVQTMLNVLHRKGKVKRQLNDRAYRYKPVYSRQSAVTQAVGEMLERFFGGSADSLVETRQLTPEKLAEIQKLLEQPGELLIVSIWCLPWWFPSVEETGGKIFRSNG